MPALLAVVAAFMAGMALGAWRISGIRIDNPGRCYACLEIGIGLWAAITAVLIPAANRLALNWIGFDPSPLRHWLIAFVIPAVVLLPATAAMGATLPVIERFVTPLTLRGRSVGALYAANTLGAVVGVLGSTFIVLPRVGLRATIFVFAAVNILCGLIALALSSESQPVMEEAKCAEAPNRRRLRATLFMTGLLGIGYEVVGVRLLAQVLENTVYTYAAVLAVFLLGTALGAAAYHRGAARLRLADLISVTALACMAGVFAATQAGVFYQSCRSWLGDGVTGVLLADMTVACSVFLLPTMAMGATFSHLVQSAAARRGGMGVAVAINTVGAALAPVVFSVMLLPWIGSKWTLVLIAAGYLLVLPRLSGWRWLVPVPIALLMFLPPSQLRFVTAPVGGRLLEFGEGVMASVSVVQDATEHKSLRVDNRFQMGGTGAADAEYRHAHVPLLLHPHPRRALFLGLGTGITFDAAALHANLIAEGVELLPEVVEMMPQFSPYNDATSTNARLRMFVADARRFVQATTNTYDVIVGDLFHPARDGAGSLYTVEHFQSIRARLASGGLFCQWLPLHQLDQDMLRVITRTFLEVFPNAQAWLLRFHVEAPVIGLLGTTAPVAYSPAWIEGRTESPQLTQRLQRLALNDSLRLFGNLLAGPDELRALAGNGRINTDDNSALLFGGPRFAYLRNASSYGRLLPLLELRLTNTTSALGFDSPGLSRFIAARNAFIHGLIAETEGQMDTACDRYIESARLSEDFTAGYARIVTIATAESKSNPANSRTLLERLIEAQPSRPVARELSKRLFPD